MILEFCKIEFVITNVMTLKGEHSHSSVKYCVFPEPGQDFLPN
ncbi:MAG: hypothetical protein YK1312THETA_330002 [Marine Group I thaumarchaeote]|nr:MAG: hypothetical protein YK1312THETA_330002 [Marine Group I thaumarchaeote]